MWGKMKTFIQLIILIGTTINTFASTREDAYKLFTRITSIPPTKSELSVVEQYLNAENKLAAINFALESKHFYNIKLKNWVKNWTNEDRTNRVELNDYVATVIGFIRDDVPFNQILSADYIYTANDSLTEIPAYSVENNNHYAEIEKRNLSLKDNLVRKNQSTITGITQTAGVLTTRAAAAAFFIDGTNRAMTRYTFMNFLCKDFEDVHDTNVPDFLVRRDVDRAPGGDSRTFKNTCVGCHAGQDALGGAFAYFNFANNKITYTPGVVTEKINKNVNYPAGHVVTDDSWMNLWAKGTNANLGWRGSMSGKGVKSLGQMLANSKQFSRCMVEKTYKLICLNSAKNNLEDSEIEDLVIGFETNYKMKELFSEVALKCL